MFNLGDSQKEIEIDMAQGFPDVAMTPYDMIIPDTFAELFGIKDQIDQGLPANVNLTFDLLKMAL
jgi:hypothetical protein